MERIVDQLANTSFRPKPNKRPRGRTPGALPCNNPFPDWKTVLKNCHNYLSSGGKKAFLGPVMEKAISRTDKLVYSNHTHATCRAEGWSHRHPLGLRRDITLWKVLFMTVNLANAEQSGDWFMCAVDAKTLNDLSSLDSLTRSSRFLDLFKKTGFLKVTYKSSKKGNGLQKWCLIRISKAAFYAAGITPQELESEIARKRRNDARRRNTPGTKEFENPKASIRRLDRVTRKAEQANRKAKILAAQNKKQERELQNRQFELKREATIEFAKYYSKHSHLDKRTCLSRFLSLHPHFKNCFDTLSTN